MKQADFIAKLKYRTAEEGGRRGYASSGYQPQLKFPFMEMQTSGRQLFIGKDIVMPGETVMAQIRMVSPQFYENQLEVGMEFEFREGANVIGTGRIIDILNKSLVKQQAN